ncbi:MAG: DUF2238 domain-containing protein [Acidobacteriota bacterium]
MGLTSFLVVSLLAPLFPKEQFPQHLPMPFALGLLLWCARRGVMSDRSMLCLVCFLALHVVGARYVYSNVPFGERLSWLALGGDLPTRNHYDRLVHLAFGFLLALPIGEWALRRWRAARLQAWVVALVTLLAVSALYEIFEWLLTIVAAPGYAESYNGQQGDAWDAQKDMALALLGSALAWPLFRAPPSQSEELTANHDPVPEATGR